MTPDAPSAERLKGLLARREFPAKFGQILDEFLQAYRRALSMAGLNPDAYDHLSSRFIERLEAQRGTRARRTGRQTRTTSAQAICETVASMAAELRRPAAR